MESKVCRPITRTCPIVVRLKNAKSSGRCHGMSGPLPMTPFRATAAMRVTWVIYGSSTGHLRVIYQSSTGHLYSDGCLDSRVCVVPHQLEVLELELVQRPSRSDPHLGQCARRAGQLQPRLVEMVEVEVSVAEGVDELPGLQVAYLRHHRRQERVRRDVERDPEKDVGG